MDSEFWKSLGIALGMVALCAALVIVPLFYAIDRENKRKAAIYERLTGEKIDPYDAAYFEFIVDGSKPMARKK